jgi:hypothetical protein
MAQKRVEEAINPLMEELDINHFRKMQVFLILLFILIIC